MFSLHRVGALLSCVALAGCAAGNAALAPVPFSVPPSTGLFGGVAIQYDSTVEAGRLYRTASPGALEFGSKLKPLCDVDFEHIDIKTGK